MHPRTDVGTMRELVKRLILAELLARPGQGPLAPRAVRRGPAPRSAPETPRDEGGASEP